MVKNTNVKYVNPVWYMDSGANAHITSNAFKLAEQQPFHDSDFVTVGNGSGLQTQNISSSSFQFGPSGFHLNKILHCPQATSNLISINHFV
jgi:hypothetical protein